MSIKNNVFNILLYLAISIEAVILFDKTMLYSGTSFDIHEFNFGFLVLNQSTNIYVINFYTTSLF
jgi:hypothetical protein